MFWLSTTFNEANHILPLLMFFFFFFIYVDTNFSWANAGATVFGSAVPSAPKNNEEEGSDEEEAPNNVDIHFEPIVSLPEVRCSHVELNSTLTYIDV